MQAKGACFSNKVIVSINNLGLDLGMEMQSSGLRRRGERGLFNMSHHYFLSCTSHRWVYSSGFCCCDKI